MKCAQLGNGKGMVDIERVTAHERVPVYPGCRGSCEGQKEEICAMENVDVGGYDEPWVTTHHEFPLLSSAYLRKSHQVTGKRGDRRWRRSPGSLVPLSIMDRGDEGSRDSAVPAAFVLGRLTTATSGARCYSDVMFGVMRTLLMQLGLASWWAWAGWRLGREAIPRGVVVRKEQRATSSVWTTREQGWNGRSEGTIWLTSEE
ncbi:hypothetical protein EI94DRAFT_1703126 [Lactarius quietus]|nr:hypothetical protein EI94DRAFT_1703126 [Lactarius quietus]